MAKLSYIALELLLAETFGWFGKAGEPVMYCRFKAFHLPGHGFDSACVSVLAKDPRSGVWHEFAQPLSFEQAGSIAEMLVGMGLPERTLAVEGVSDTADVWTDLFFRVKSLDKAWSLDLHTQASGFDGPDAETLRALFRQLFDYAGYKDFNHSLYR